MVVSHFDDFGLDAWLRSASYLLQRALEQRRGVQPDELAGSLRLRRHFLEGGRIILIIEEHTGIPRRLLVRDFKDVST